MCPRSLAPSHSLRIRDPCCRSLGHPTHPRSISPPRRSRRPLLRSTSLAPRPCPRVTPRSAPACRHKRERPSSRRRAHPRASTEFGTTDLPDQPRPAPKAALRSPGRALGLRRPLRRGARRPAQHYRFSDAGQEGGWRSCTRRHSGGWAGPPSYTPGPSKRSNRHAPRSHDGGRGEKRRRAACYRSGLPAGVGFGIGARRRQRLRGKLCARRRCSARCHRARSGPRRRSLGRDRSSLERYVKSAQPAWRSTRTVPKLVTRGFLHGSSRGNRLELRCPLGSLRPDLMLPLTVQFLVAMLAECAGRHGVCSTPWRHPTLPALRWTSDLRHRDTQGGGPAWSEPPPIVTSREKFARYPTLRDGTAHARRERSDARRDRELRRMGFTVLRLDARLVMREHAGVVGSVRKAIAALR
jgi:hypothetical protein